MTPWRVLLAGVATLGLAPLLVSCSPGSPAVTLGPTYGTIHMCVSEFAQPLTYGELVRLAPGIDEITLLHAELIGAVGVRATEQAVARDVLLDDGTHLGVGMALTTDGGEAWDGRIPLDGATIRTDDRETWFVALAIERTTTAASGFDAVDLTYEANGQQQVARGSQSMSFPETGAQCSE